ncbi:MAG: hypothetical protein C0606_13785 [Hyphomicrobiales bacterium]|nr:MAG: hypothetical protein C0606_13785 [Hyphomicrobiales bacterium]
MCTINGLVFVEPIGAGMASMPAPEEEPLVISASDPQPVEPAPAGAEPVADDDLDGEPMVITSQTENPFPNARVPQPRPYPQIVF